MQFTGGVVKKMRYETVGDWYDDGEHLTVKVADMGNDDYHLLVLIHELVEAYLCRKAGVKEEDVSAFDIEFEKNRKEGNTDEPGDEPEAPYFLQHQSATRVERQLAAELGVNWNEYDEFVCNLDVVIE